MALKKFSLLYITISFGHWVRSLEAKIPILPIFRLFCLKLSVFKEYKKVSLSLSTLIEIVSLGRLLSAFDSWDQELIELLLTDWIISPDCKPALLAGPSSRSPPITGGINGSIPKDWAGLLWSDVDNQFVISTVE